MEHDGGLIWFQCSIPQHLRWEMYPGVEDTGGTAAGGRHFGSKSAAFRSSLLQAAALLVSWGDRSLNLTAQHAFNYLPLLKLVACLASKLKPCFMSTDGISSAQTQVPLPCLELYFST